MVKLASYVLGGAIAVQLLPVAQTGNWWGIFVLATTIVGTGWRLNSQLKKIHEKTFLLSVEHEMLVGDYCERKGIKVRDLPTRQVRGAGA